MSDDYMPEVCGESNNTMGVCICKLACLPCPVYYGDGNCPKKISDEAIARWGKKFKEEQT